MKYTSYYIYPSWVWSYSSLYRAKTKTRIDKSKNPLPRTSKSSRKLKLAWFVERVKRITSRDYNPIFDTDFSSLVRYDPFSSLLYGSGPFFFKSASGMAVPRVRLRQYFRFPKFVGQVVFRILICHCSLSRQYYFVKTYDFANMKGRGKVCVLKIGSRRKGNKNLLLNLWTKFTYWFVTKTKIVYLNSGPAVRVTKIYF